MRIILLMFLLLLGQSAFALGCDKAVNTLEINDCASIEKEKVESQLNATYKSVIQKLEHPEPEVADDYLATKKALVEAQRAWVKFREADCDATYTWHRGGTIRTLMYIGCMQAHAEQRIKELKEYESQ
jgi:uncharacterized protein YecT (DUF1311 family)